MKGTLFLAGLVFVATGASAQMYRWVDQTGKVHYSDTPPPPAAAKSIQQKKLGSSVVETSQVPFQLQEAVRSYPVVLYTSPSCKDGCSLARDLLAKRGTPFREVSVADEDSNALLKKVSGANQVPTLAVGSQVTIGFETGAFNSLLDSAGYPKTAINLPGVARALAPPPTAKPAEVPTPSAPNAPSAEPTGGSPAVSDPPAR
jgi:glutaredoxin